MKIIADVGGTRGRWILVDKTIIKKIETAGYNPYLNNPSLLDNILFSLRSQTKTLNINQIFYYGAGINNSETKDIDTSDLKSVKKFLKTHKKTDILVLNSGGPPPLKMNSITIDVWKKYFNQLFLSFFLIIKHIKINKNGYIFYISSSIIKEPGEGLVISSSLRSAMSSLLKSYSVLNSKNGISSINIAPGPFNY